MPGVIRGIGPFVERPAKVGDQLRFEFELLAGDDEIDQTLTIENPGASSLAPVLEITPLDASGDPMPDVKARTAYGSDSGRLVVPADWAVLDVLRFEGSGARDVEDVEVRVREAEEVEIESPTEEPEIKLFDRGRSVEYDHLWDTFRVTNPGETDVPLRVVLIEYFSRG